MSLESGLDRCLSYINCQLKPHSFGQLHDGQRFRAVTISRQTGSGAHEVAVRLAEALQTRTHEAAPPWTVVDRDLVEKVLQEHHLPARLARFMQEDRISEISDTMDELFGLHPSSWTLVHKTAETILHLVELGNVIIIGRGAHLVTFRRTDVLHIRLVAPLEQRLKYVQQHEHLSEAAARHLINNEDLGRKRFLRKYFNRDIEDSLLYHLVLNTDLLSFDQVAESIAQAVLTPAHAEFQSHAA